MFNNDSLLELEYKLNVEECKRDFSKFVRFCWPILEPGTEYKHNWHIDLICEYLMAVHKGEIRRLIVNMPPRHMKSLLISVMYPAWLWVNDPTEKIVVTSYAHSISTDLSIKRRVLFRSDEFQKAFGDIFQFSKDVNKKDQYLNDKGGVMYTAGVGTLLTGRGGNTIIVDDPHSPEEVHSDAKRRKAVRYFQGTLSSRVDDKKKGSVIVVMQRLHEDDLTGSLLEKGGWTHLVIPAISEEKEIIETPVSKKRFVRDKDEILWPDREGKEELEKTKEDMGPYQFSAQYQQKPAPAVGGIIKKLYFNFYQTLPENLTTMLQTWDCNFNEGKRNDYVCGQVWGKKGSRKYLIDMVLAKMELQSTIACIKKWAVEYPRAIAKVIESKANGPAVMQSLSDELEGILGIHPDGSKVARVHAVMPMFHSRNIYVPCYNDPTEWNQTEIHNRNLEMFSNIDMPEWVEKFVESCANFPTHKYDDDIDAMTQGLLHLRNLVDTSEDYFKIKVRKSNPSYARGRRNRDPLFD